jgi:hypothetical protein
MNRALVVVIGISLASCEGSFGKSEGVASESPGVQPTPVSDAGPGDVQSHDSGFRDAGPPPIACGGEQFCLENAGLPRLTAQEYLQTVVAALGSAAGAAISTGLPADGKAGPFASNDLSAVNSDMVAQYQLAAEKIAAALVPTVDAVLGCSTASSPSDSCVNAFIDRVGGTLFRGALAAEERTTYLALFRSTQMRSSAADAVRVVVTAWLQSPRFLYHLRIGRPVSASVLPGQGAVSQLTGTELAERLSYLLLSGPPDQALREAAAAGELDSVSGLQRQARRLLADAKADFSLGRFFTLWLGVDDLPVRSFSATIYPGVQALRESMFEETRAFGAYVMRQGDARLQTLLSAEWTVAPGALRSYYGLDAVSGGPARFDLPPGQRSGLLTHAGFLATHTHDPSTQAVHRGKAIRELLLCQTIPPPPADIDPNINPDPNLSPRQRLEAKTGEASCAGCHLLMNPTGFLFERFDVTGRHRSMVADPASGRTFAIDDSGGVPVSDISGDFAGHRPLGAALASSIDVQKCVTRQWFRYAMGRPERGPADERSIEQAYKSFASGGDLRELLVGLVATDAFRYRRAAQ